MCVLRGKDWIYAYDLNAMTENNKWEKNAFAKHKWEKKKKNRNQARLQLYQLQKF